MAILAKAVETIVGLVPNTRSILDALDGVQCLSQVADSGGSLSNGISGEAAGAVTRAFFDCVGTLGDGVINGPAKVILAMLSAAPSFLAAGILGLVNEIAGQSSYSIDLNVERTQTPTVPSVATLKEADVCGAKAKITGHTWFVHPTWGESVLVSCLDRGKEGGLAVLDAAGTVRWSFEVCCNFYQLKTAKPGADASGNLFVLYDPGRYRSVAILRPKPGGMTRLAGIFGASDDEVAERFYSSKLEGPDKAGRYSVRAYQNDCDPSCAGGTTTSSRYVWNGKDYVRA